MVEQTGRIVAVDFDGTITREAGHPHDISTWVAMGDKTQNTEVTDWMRERYIAGDIIVVYTARWWKDYHEIKAWLDERQIHYNMIQCGKLKADVYLDDRAMKLEDIVEGSQ